MGLIFLPIFFQIGAKRWVTVFPNKGSDIIILKVILFHLVFSLSMDLSGDEFRRKYKRIYNKVVQIAVAQSIIVCALFWGLQIGGLTFQNFHEHVMNFVVMIISYTVSEGKSFIKKLT